jgi:hypothetical protein
MAESVRGVGRVVTPSSRMDRHSSTSCPSTAHSEKIAESTGPPLAKNVSAFRPPLDRRGRRRQPRPERLHALRTRLQRIQPRDPRPRFLCLVVAQ